MKNSYFLLFFFFAFTSQAQSIKGEITNSEGLAIADVYIQNIQNKVHAHSNFKGEFTLENAKIGDSISLSHKNYEELRAVLTSIGLYVMTTKAISLKEVVITNEINHLNEIAKIDLKTNPVNSPQELLRIVPGLFIGQHAGGGKAEQIFLRGFDIDHGTDIAINVDGVPVNMISHAHGQGYADLHFLQAETVANVSFDKGAYFADKGNLATAGFVDFSTKDRISNDEIALEVGQFNTQRLRGMFNLIASDKESLYFSGSYLQTDGFFDAPQNFNRTNIFSKYTLFGENDKLSISLSHFDSKWNASGQIPQRAVDQGLIGNFGAIDDTEGGNTSRSIINVQHTKQLSENTNLKTNAYVSLYDFELYSNFTFFLEDPINGDQIRQKESRTTFGLNSAFEKKTNWNAIPVKYQVGVGLRQDKIDNIELSRTANRITTLENVMLGDINESNISGFGNAEFKFNKLLVNAGLRYDFFNFDYYDKLAENYTNGAENKGIISPKLNFSYQFNDDFQLFLKSGKGFHSNDTRVNIANGARKTLPASYGSDFGFIWKPLPKMVFNSAIWYLFLEQEFVYVGDAGIVEPSGKTERKGIDLGLRYQMTDWLFLNADYTYSHARSTEEPRFSNYIPLAPRSTFMGSLSVVKNRFSGSLRSRILGDRPANEEFTLIAEGYFVSDLNLNYTFKNITAGILVENIFNTQWKETQFETESRLQNETQPVSEIHFTPGTPFNFRAVLTYKF
jgi:outer membrane cobalamin receptor